MSFSSSHHYLALWTPGPCCIQDKILSFDEPTTAPDAVQKVIDDEANKDSIFSGIIRTAPRLDFVILVPLESHDLEVVKSDRECWCAGATAIVQKEFKKARRGDNPCVMFSLNDLIKETKRWTLVEEKEYDYA